MTKERWDDLVSTILDKFPVSNRGEEPLVEGPGHREFIEFTSPAGEMRLEFVTRPVVTGKHTAGGRKIGVATQVTYEYSDSEFSEKLLAYQKLNGEWQEIDATAFMK